MCPYIYELNINNRKSSLDSFVDANNNDFTISRCKIQKGNVRTGTK